MREKIIELKHIKDVLYDMADDLANHCDEFFDECELCPVQKKCHALDVALDSVKKLYNMEVNTDEK